MSKSATDPSLSGFPLPIPMFIEQTPKGDRAMDLFSRLLVDRIIFIGYPIIPELANIVVAQLLFLDMDAPDREITIYINSPGGSISAGNAIIDTMHYVRPPIRTVCIGHAASMAAWILAAGEKGMRQALPSAEIMIHQPLIGGGGLSGQATDIEIAARHMARTKDRMVQKLAAYTGKDPERIRADIDRDNNMYADEALAYGIIDSIVEKMPPPAPKNPER